MQGTLSLFDTPVTEVEETRLTRTYSKYQEAVFGFHTKKGHGLVLAGPGSGKTTTSVEFCNRLSDRERERTAFFAFNRDISQVLKERLPNKEMARTFHATGRRILMNHFDLEEKNVKNWIDNYKYHRLAEKWWKYTAPTMSWGKVKAAVVASVDLLEKLMLTRSDVTNRTQVDHIALHYGILDYFADADRHQECVVAMTKKGRELLPKAITFTDMLCWPTLLEAEIPTQAWVLVDEAQDLSAASRALVMAHLGPESRALVVGDPRQAIYGFAGAEVNSMEMIGQMLDATNLPLNVCYRCPISHIRLAQEMMPDLEAAPGAKEGVVAYGRIEDLYLEESPGEDDLILCRTTAPLIKLALRLIGRKIPAAVRGRDIGQGLVDILGQVEGVEPDFRCLFGAMGDVRDLTIDALVKQKGSEMAVENVRDRFESLMVLSTRAIADGVKDFENLRSFVKSLFSDCRTPVTLSTIHKAKGQEAERVFLLHPELLPHPKALQDWEVVQEGNLRYVALTRAKDQLTFLSDPGEDVV